MTQQFKFICPNEQDTKVLGAKIGAAVRGGEVIELKSDLGGGKTTFAKGLGQGMGVKDVVQSPSFTISFIHKAAKGLELHHFDFYRLQDAGIMSAELAESINQPNAVVAIEWGEIVHDILPANHLTVTLNTQDNEAREVVISAPHDFKHIITALEEHKKALK